jgi:hypothetical protein
MPKLPEGVNDSALKRSRNLMGPAEEDPSDEAMKADFP